MRLSSNGRQLLMVGKNFHVGLVRLGKHKGLFKVRNLARIRREGHELGTGRFFATLKEAVAYAKTI